MTNGDSVGEVVIDVFPSSVERYVEDHAIVAIDVIRATTMAVTALALGRRCLIARDLDDAFALKAACHPALLAGELGGDQPDGFDLNNSPTELLTRQGDRMPLVMLSSSGTALMTQASRSKVGAYVACLRNLEAVASYLAGRHPRVAVIGAGSRGTFREEDQLGCARLADRLLSVGYRAGPETLRLVEQWRDAPSEAWTNGDSAAYLHRTNQSHDLDFVVDYALRLGSALTVARVGFFLEQHKDELLVEDRHLEALRARAPAQPRYFERRHRKGGTLVPRWKNA